MQLVHFSTFPPHWCMAKALSRDALWKDVPMPHKPGPTAASHGNTITETAEEGANKRPLIYHGYTLKSLSSRNSWKQHCLYGANEKGDAGWHCGLLQWPGKQVPSGPWDSSSPSQSKGRIQLLSSQSGRRFYSLTLTSLLSQGFHTLPASLFWGSNILPRKKLFPTSNLKHCCNCSHHFLSPCPWTWRTDYSLCSAAAFYTLQPCFPTSFSSPHTEICEHCQWLPSLAHLGWTWPLCEDQSTRPVH